MKKKVFHVISNTHWDREWRFPFQRNRQMLVDMIDEVLRILTTEPDYRAFHLDSQSIVLKDYLEIRPHKKNLIKKLVKQNRLLIGPWYILPEEFQVGGENLVRNLLIGHKICREMGGVSKIGYSPFSWGQISQLPQIYKDFGIELIMFYRGINSLDSPKAEFIWEGADGTRAVTSRFSTMPRYNFYFYIYRPVVHGESITDVEYKWSSGGKAFHFADAEQNDEDYFITVPNENYFKENIIPQVKSIIKDQADDFTTQHVIWMEGHDSSGPNAKTVKIIKDIKHLMQDIDVKHSTLEEYSKALHSAVDKKKLKLVKGERRSSQFDRRSGNLYGYTTSARMYLKQINFDAERWIQFYAEPFNAISGILGRDIKDNYPEMAWDYIVQNSAHDSIGGCSLDEIHFDMEWRYKQAIEISKGIFERSLKHITKLIDTSVFKHAGNSQIFLTAVNPNNYDREEVVEAVIDIPKEFDKDNFQIIDEKGNPVEVQLIEKAEAQPVLEQMIDRPMYFDMQRYYAHLFLNEIPSFGYKTFNVKPVSQSFEKDKNILREFKNGIQLDNKFITVRLNKNGTFNVLHKETGHEFKQLGYFYDEGEAGHAWINIPRKPFITTLKSEPAFAVIENGNLSATVKVSHEMKIYETLTARKTKSDNFVYNPIDLYLTLKKNSKRLDIEILADNKAESHRLRFMMPTNLDVKHSYGEGQFDVVKRSTDRPKTKDWIEQPMYDYPMHQFVDVTDGNNGFAVLVDGLKEYEILNDKKKTLAITLFRGFEYIIQPSSKQDYTFQKGSQCLGEQFFNLSFYPHTGDWLKGEVYKEALNFNNSIRLVQMGGSEGKLPATAGFIKLEPEELIFSALKKSEDEKSNSYVLRFYNPTNKKITGKVTTLFKLQKVEQLTLEEKFVDELKLTDQNKFSIKAEKKKIITLKIYIKR